MKPTSPSLKAIARLSRLLGQIPEQVCIGGRHKVIYKGLPPACWKKLTPRIRARIQERLVTVWTEEGE